MKDEFKAINSLLLNGKNRVPRNKVWSHIHEETNLGVVKGRELLFTAEELYKLRQYGSSLTGGKLDPQFNQATGSRIELAQRHHDEKFSSQSVFGNLLLMATAGCATVTISGTSTTTQAGSVLAVKSDAFDQQLLQQQCLIVIENGSLLPDWQRIRLPQGWKNAVLVYRGHGDNAGCVNRLVAQQPSESLAFYYDFDPAGMAMALRWGRGYMLLPADWPALDCNSASSVNQRTTFRQQYAELKLAHSLARTALQRRIVEFMGTAECAIMQEHLTVRGCLLTPIAL